MKTSNFNKRVATPTFYVMMCKWQAYSVFSFEEKLASQTEFWPKPKENCLGR